MTYDWEHIANYGPWKLFAAVGPAYCVSKTTAEDATGIFFTIPAALSSRAIRRPFEGGAQVTFPEGK